MIRRSVLAVFILTMLAAAGLGFSATRGEPESSTGASSKLSTARDAFKTIDQMRVAGQHIDSTKHYNWSRRLMEAEREAAGTKARRVAAARAHVERMGGLMKDIRLQWEHAEVSRLEFLDTQFHYDEAVSWWEAEKAK